MHAVTSSVGANQRREIVMTNLKLIAAAMAVLGLSACVALVVPIPLSSSTTTQDTTYDERRAEQR